MKTEHLLPMDNDFCSCVETRIKRHSVARARLGQMRPAYVVGDLDFDHAVMRINADVKRAQRPDTGAPTAYFEIGFGTSVVRVFAGGPLIPDGKIEVIDL
jgi:hypothetical protein